MLDVRSTGTNRIALAGEVTFANAVEAEQAGWKLLSACALGPVTCDLSDLTSGSSVTAAVLMAWHGKLLKRGGALTLDNVPPRLRSILAASHLLPEFSIK